MAGKRLAMSKRTEIIRLKSMGLHDRAIARSIKCSRNTVKKCLTEQPPPIPTTTPVWVTELDWSEIYKDFLKGVPLTVLWEERVDRNKMPVQYAGFWKQFIRKYPDIKDATMVRRFSPGERVEIDYCDGINVLDIATGEILKTELFVGALCFSRYVYAEFTFSQKSCDFLSSHVRMFEFFGGVPATVTPDNLKSAVSKVHKYDPERNPAYVRLAEHYNTVITPARVRAPKDKAVVERTIQIFQRWFYYRVRNKTFTSLVDLNQSLREHLMLFHQKKHRIFQQTRAEMFAEEKQHLGLLPDSAYVVVAHKKATLHDDCHIQFEKSFYSAPWGLRGQRLDVWFNDKIVEIWHGRDRVAVHQRCVRNGHFRTDPKHYPPHHQAYLEITPSYLREKAERIGKHTFMVIDELFRTRYPLQYLRRAQGIISLSDKYSFEALEAACAQALLFGKYYVAFIEGLIKNEAVQVPDKKIQRLSNPLLRGAELYQ